MALTRSFDPVIFYFREARDGTESLWEIRLDVNTGKAVAYDRGVHDSDDGGTSIPLTLQRQVQLQVDATEVPELRARVRAPAVDILTAPIWNTNQTLATILAPPS